MLPQLANLLEPLPQVSPEWADAGDAANHPTTDKGKRKKSGREKAVENPFNCLLLRNRIITARIPRVATKQSPDCQPSAPPCAVSGNRLASVTGARWRETACRRCQWAYQILVSLYQANQCSPYYRAIHRAAASNCLKAFRLSTKFFRLICRFG